MYKPCELCKKDYEPRKDKFFTSRFCSKPCQLRGLGIISGKNLHKKWELEDPKKARIEKLKNFIKKEKECWIWTGNNRSSKLPYGRVSFRGKQVMAHRLSYEAYIGEIPKGRLVLHTCDNPECVNPKHLYTGNYQDNQNDKRLRDRCKVEKLSEENVMEIKNLIKYGYSMRYIGNKFNCSPTNICNIKNGKIWKWVK